MHLEGVCILAARPDAVWEQLLVPEVLQACIPGCEALELTDVNTYLATVVIKVGPVKARFAGTVTLSDLHRPHSLKLTGQGTGGVAGFAKGEATIQLEAHDQGTQMSYDATMQIGGKIASLGDRVFRSTVVKNVDAFFEAVTLRF